MFHNYGYCPCCDQETRFESCDDWFRDHYICTRCASIPRERALMVCIEKFYPDWRNLVIHESSPSERGASLRLRKEAPNYFFSHYFPGVQGGKLVDGVRCEDLEALSMEDCSIDLHISQDVFEHLFNPAAAFREIARTLKPGGAHIFTTPLVNKEKNSQWTVRQNSDGIIEQLTEKLEYHGNPISEKGSLVTVNWGYDIMHFIHQSSGLFTSMICIDNLDLGIRAEYIEVLVSRREIV